MTTEKNVTFRFDDITGISLLQGYTRTSSGGKLQTGLRSC